jgi:Uma2 family endonuclease
MSAAKRLTLVSVKDYLAAELESPIKHDYVGGLVYALPDTRNRHNIIKGNLLGSLHAQLRGRGCWPFDSNTKIRIHLPTQIRFYYPDLSVICQQNSQNDSFQDRPAAIFEVLSLRTRRIDEVEKKDAYLTIPSLSVYVLFEQDMVAGVVVRRTEQGFVREVYEGRDAVMALGKLGDTTPTLALAEVYDGVEFGRPEPQEGDGN